jgi:lysophospholipase L1-like esterase
MLKRLVTSGRQTPDAIMIWAGTNGAGQPSTDNYDEIMGLTWEVLSANDNTGWTYRKTFYGGLRFTLEYLYRNFQYATIYIFSPVQTNPADYRTYSALTTTRNALEKMAKRYACIFCDALTESGIVDLFEKADGTGYWLGDGLHPKAAGKVLMKNYAHRKITTTYYNKKD